MLASPRLAPAAHGPQHDAVPRHDDRPSPAARPHARLAAHAEVSALLNQGARARAVAQLTQRLGRRPSSAARQIVAADNRGVQARGPAQRVTEGTLTVPPNPARTTARPDAQISIALPSLAHTLPRFTANTARAPGRSVTHHRLPLPGEYVSPSGWSAHGCRVVPLPPSIGRS